MPESWRIPYIRECGHWCSGRWSPKFTGRCCLCMTMRKGMLKTDWDYVTLMRCLVRECCDTCKGREPEHYAEAKTFIEDFDAGNYDARVGEE